MAACSASQEKLNDWSRVMAKWTHDDIPALEGRSAVVMGTGGLGFESALALSRAGADVIIAGRNPVKGTEAVAPIKREVPGVRVCFEPVDLASLHSRAGVRSSSLERRSLSCRIRGGYRWCASPP
jgi:thioredoxin reductase